MLLIFRHLDDFLHKWQRFILKKKYIGYKDIGEICTMEAISIAASKHTFDRDGGGSEGNPSLLTTTAEAVLPETEQITPQNMTIVPKTL